MPQAFIVQDPRTGRKLRLEGDAEPTPEQLNEIFGSFAQGEQPQPQLQVEPAKKVGEYLINPETLPQEKEPSLGGKLREVGTSMGATTAGQMLGALGGPIGIAVGGAIGGGVGNIVNQLQRMAEDPNYKFKWGEFMAETGTGAIPGGSFLGGGAKALAKEAGKQALGGVVAANIESKFDRGEFQTAGQNLLSAAAPAVGGLGAQTLLAKAPEVVSSVAKALKTPPKALATLEAGQKLGLKAVPSDLDPSFVTTKAESLGGAVASRRKIQLDNQDKVNQAVKEELGITAKEISPEALAQVRKTEGAVYDEIETISKEAKPQLDKLMAQRREIELRDDLTPYQKHDLLARFDEASKDVRGWLETQAAASVQELRRIRGEAQKAMDAYYASGGKSVDMQTKAFDLRQQAKDLEASIEASVRSMGKENLADKLVAARKRIAQTYSAEDALNVGNNNIDPNALARQLDKGVPLSGNLLAIAEFKKAFQNSLQEASKIPEPSVSHTAMALGGLAGIGTYAGTQSVPAAAVATALPLSRDIARAYVGSKGTQRRATEAFRERLLSPQVEIPTGVATGEKLLRTGGQAVARTEEPDVPSAEDVKALQANPDKEREAFEARFGKGSATKYLFKKAK